MVAVTALRSTLAAALSDPTNYSVYSYPPANLTANSVVISADEPYLEPQNNQYNSIAPMANFKVTLMVPLLDNQASLGDIEALMVNVFNKLATSSLSIRMGNFTAPTVMGVDAGQMLSSDLSISILVTSWS